MNISRKVLMRKKEKDVFRSSSRATFSQEEYSERDQSDGHQTEDGCPPCIPVKLREIAGSWTQVHREIFLEANEDRSDFVCLSRTSFLEFQFDEKTSFWFSSYRQTTEYVFWNLDEKYSFFFYLQFQPEHLKNIGWKKVAVWEFFNKRWIRFEIYGNADALKKTFSTIMSLESIDLNEESLTVARSRRKPVCVGMES